MTRDREEVVVETVAPIHHQTALLNSLTIAPTQALPSQGSNSRMMTKGFYGHGSSTKATTFPTRTTLLQHLVDEQHLLWHLLFGGF